MNGRKLEHEGEAGLERLCKTAAEEHIIHDASIPGLERMEAQFVGEAFAPHRHDTYALGVTMGGVQSFLYRGERRFSLPCSAIVIHPDELHDGAAGDETALKYRMLYLEPALLAPALTRSALPFVDNPVVENAELTRLLLSMLGQMGDRIEGLEADAFVALLAPMLERLASGKQASSGFMPLKSLERARDFLAEHADENISSAELEAVSGLDRFTLNRHFRRAYGTTPHRFLVMRRLASARARIARGMPLAEIAAETGFADQAHLTRHFKKAYGMTPGRWAELALNRT